MPVRIFTIPFNEETQTFHDDLVQQFCVNKRVHKIETKFFTRNHQPFWTVAVHFGQILSAENNIRVSGTPTPEQTLDDQQKSLLLRLKEWRKGAAGEAGFPVYLVATNAHLVLLDIIARKIKDRRLLGICEKIIRHGNPNEAHGLPIGSRTSQFFANVYLDPLDHFLKDRCQASGYVRYMDDFVLFEPDKNRLKWLRSASEDFLGEKLRLRLKPSATFLNSRQNGLSFLGRRIFPGIIRLQNENLRRITARMALREKQFVHGDLNETAFLHSLNSYWAMLSYYPELMPLRQALLHQ